MIIYCKSGLSHKPSPNMTIETNYQWRFLSLTFRISSCNTIFTSLPPFCSSSQDDIYCQLSIHVVRWATCSPTRGTAARAGPTAGARPSCWPRWRPSSIAARWKYFVQIVCGENIENINPASFDPRRFHPLRRWTGNWGKCSVSGVLVSLELQTKVREDFTIMEKGPY